MPEAKTITRDELKKKLDAKEDFVLINVLAASSYEAMHIPGSINIDVHQPDFLDNVAEAVPDKNKDIVVHCSSFTCQSSPLAAQKLTEAGYTNVRDFSGGLADWNSGGFALEGPAVS